MKVDENKKMTLMEWHRIRKSNPKPRKSVLDILGPDISGISFVSVDKNSCKDNSTESLG